MKMFENLNVPDDPAELLKKEITFCSKTDGKTFVARLIDYNDKELWFETKSGNIIMNQRAEISNMSKYVPKVV